MNIVLAEDQPLILESLKVLIEEEGDIRVVAVARTGHEALEAIRRESPDIAVLDLRMPGLTGLEVLSVLKAEQAGIPVLLLTTFEDAAAIAEAVAIGVEGFLLKDVDPKVFTSALRAVAGGLTVFHPVVRPHLTKGIATSTGTVFNPYGLTVKDLSVIAAIVRGLGNKEIADCVGCTEGTVKNRVSSILGKMNLNARTQIAVKALKEGLA